jgi:hypothetical protein
MSRRKAKQESQPCEIFLSINGAKPKFCCRVRSRQDAEARWWTEWLRPKWVGGWGHDVPTVRESDLCVAREFSRQDSDLGKVFRGSATSYFSYMEMLHKKPKKPSVRHCECEHCMMWRAYIRNVTNLNRSLSKGRSLQTIELEALAGK